MTNKLSIFLAFCTLGCTFNVNPKQSSVLESSPNTYTLMIVTSSSSDIILKGEVTKVSESCIEYQFVNKGTTYNKIVCGGFEIIKFENLEQAKSYKRRNL